MKPSTYNTLSLAVVWSIAFTLAALAFSPTPGCVGAPRTVDQISTMTPEQWQAYLRRVYAWSEAAGYSLVKERPDEFEHVMKFTSILGTLTAAPGSDPVGEAVEQVEWSSPIARLVLLEAQALLEARGGFPGGERGLELLNTIASGVQFGALDANTEP